MINLDGKILAAKHIISLSLGSARKPVLLLSFGKDSLLLLHLIRQVHPRFSECLWFPEQIRGQERRNEFGMQLIKDLDLRCYTYPPSAMDVVQGEDGTLELVNVQDFGQGGMLFLPIGIAPKIDPRNFACGLDIINKPIIPWGSLEYEWDVTFIGHKSSDKCPVQGDIPLEGYWSPNGSTTMVYPLKEFTDDDVWECIERFGIQYDTNRYIGEQHEDDSTSPTTPDYYSACVECLIEKPDSPTASCPRLSGELVPRIGNTLNAKERAKNWRKAFINLSPTDSGASVQS